MSAHAAERGADGLIVDLEDAVADAHKVAARDGAATFFSSTPPTDNECWLRVNPETMAEDLAAVGDALADGIVLPKASSAAEMETAIAELRRVAHGADVIALVETAGASVEVDAIARLPGVTRLMLGEMDLGADLGMEPDSPGWDAIRVSVVVASAAARLTAPIAGVEPAFDDPERIEADTRRLAQMGFGGRGAIDPAQVDPINRAFVPSTEQIRNALDILSRHEAAVAEGVGAYRDGQGRMVDEAVVRQARRTVESARAAGVVP